jgi:hypothetical protein
LLYLFTTQQRLSTVEFKRKFNVMQHKIPTPSGSTPGGLQVGSGWIPCRFAVDSGWVPGRLRVDSGWIPGRLRVDSGWIPGRRREGSGSTRGGLRVGSDQVGLDLAPWSSKCLARNASVKYFCIYLNIQFNSLQTLKNKQPQCYVNCLPENT